MERFESYAFFVSGCVLVIVGSTVGVVARSSGQRSPFPAWLGQWVAPGVVVASGLLTVFARLLPPAIVMPVNLAAIGIAILTTVTMVFFLGHHRHHGGYRATQVQQLIGRRKPPVEIEREIRGLLAQGKRNAAIKRVCFLTGRNVQAAREYVDSLQPDDSF